MKSNDEMDGKSKRIKITFETLISGLLILGSIIVAAVFSIIAAKRQLSNLEAVLLQFFGLGIGILGSFIFGRQSAKKAAIEMVKPHARSAFRRVLYLYNSLSRLAQVTELAKNFDDSNNNTEITYKKQIAVIEAIITEQLSTAGDALEDWRDLLPEDIEELENKLKKRHNLNNRIDQ